MDVIKQVSRYLSILYYFLKYVAAVKLLVEIIVQGNFATLPISAATQQCRI